MKTSRNFRWNGAVHETVIPEGNIIYLDVVIRHRKCGKGDPDRNLRIYEKMLAGGEKLEPRHQLYYGRELYYHQRYPEAEAVLVEFLKIRPDGWKIRSMPVLYLDSATGKWERKSPHWKLFCTV